MTRPGDFVRKRVDGGNLPPEEVTPLQVAQMLLADIESGRINPEKLMVLFEEETEEGDLRTVYYCSSMTYEQILMMLEWRKRSLLRELER